jgi:hypothetical protein
MTVDAKSIQNDQRVVEAAGKLHNGQVEKRIQLLTSEYGRHPEAYAAFGEKAKEKPRLNCLMVGMANMSETMGYVATYYNIHDTTEGLNITAVDYVDRSFFTDLVGNPETYRLGKNEEGKPIVPLPGQGKAFMYDSESDEYVLGAELGKFMAETVDRGNFGVDVQSLNDLNFPEGSFDFISCQNVLMYVPNILDGRDKVVANLVSKTAIGGVVAIRTDGMNRDIATSMERQGLPVVFLTNRMEASGLYKKVDNVSENSPTGFVAEELGQKKRTEGNLKKSGNVFGI